MAMDSAVETLTELHEALLQEEANAEKAEVEERLQSLSLQELSDAGIAVPRVVITDISSGLYGRTIVTFTPKRAVLERLHGGVSAKQHQEPQQHRLSPGDIVGVFRFDRPISGSSSAVATGVVHKIHPCGLSVAFEEDNGDNWLQQHHSGPQEAGGSLGLVYSLSLVSSEVTINRQRKALRALRDHPPDSPASRVIAVCFGQAKPRFLPLHLAATAAAARVSPHAAADPQAAANAAAAAEKGLLCHDWRQVHLAPEEVKEACCCLGRKWFSETLTDSQRRAVFLSLLSQDVALIQGPPGTGKTTTVVEVLLQLAAAGLRVLACAPSNIAVDNMLEGCFVVARSHQDSQLLKNVKRCVRIGHPARVDEQLSNFCLDRQHMKSDASGVVRALKTSLDENLRELNRLKKRKAAPQAEERGASVVKRELRAEVKRLQKDIRCLQKKSVTEALSAAPIVFATCAGAADASLQSLVKGQEAAGGEGPAQEMPFDVVIIDEAAQALEASSWIPLLLGRRCVLVGDHMQLPPTVRSAEALRRGLGMSLFERLMQQLEGTASEQLVCQFRMHKHIMAWSNSVFYKGSLVAAACVENRRLCDAFPEAPADAVPPVLWIDTAGISWMREDEQGATGVSAHSAMNKSRTNRAEAALVVKYLQELVGSFSVSPADIGVITPYAAQTQLIRRLLLEAEQETESGRGSVANVTVQTVDGFQGREREVIVISLVRSNHLKEIGFLADARRLNVAVTRARSHLVIIGDSETVTEGSSAKCESSQGRGDGDSLPAQNPQQTSAAAEAGEYEQQAQDTRKALAALFEAASTFGDLRVPYEYINASDVPAADDRRSAGRAGKKECSTVDEPRSKPPQTIDGRCAPSKSKRGPVKKPCQTPKETTEAAVCKPTESAQSRGPEDDAFVARTRKLLETLRHRADLAKGKNASQVYELIHAFPSCLTSYQRLVVHQLAEELHLDHVSKGEGADRYIEVRVKLRRNQEREPRETSTNAEVAKTRNAPRGIQQQTRKSESRETSPPSEDPIRDTIVSQSASEQGEGAPEREKPSQTRKARQKPRKTPKKAASVQGEESEDIDAILEEHMKENKKCGFAGCKDSTELMGRMCAFCRSRFCLKHAMPEIHGCGDAASLEAKKNFRSQGRNNIRLMTYVEDGIIGKRAAATAGTVFINSSVGSNSQLREKLAANLRKNIEAKAKERAPHKDQEKKS